MTKDVLITISGVQMLDDDDEDVEMVTRGDYYQKNGKHYIMYDEQMEGFEGTVKNIIKVSPGSVDIIKKVRTWSNTPIIVISARSEDHDKVEALDAGADDYLTKPFSVEELLARLRVSLRRVRYDSEKVDEAASIYQNGGLKIDYAAGCTYQNGKEIHLTPIEYKLLCLLAQNTGKVLTHNYILNKIWSSALPSDTPSLRVFMATLRKKIEPDPSHPRYIQTHIGVGYRMIRQPDEEAGAESEA